MKRYITEKLPLLNLSLIFLYLSFGFSLLGFLHPEPVVHFHEYAPSRLAIEVAGHFAFGFVAAIPLLDLDISLLMGSMAVLMDVDHLLAAVGFGVSGRPDHSLIFGALLCVLLPPVARRVGVRAEIARKLALAGFVVLLSHFAYDAFSSVYVDGSAQTSFPLLIPFTFENYVVPGWLWPVLEGLAMSLSGLLNFELGSHRGISSLPEKLHVLPCYRVDHKPSLVAEPANDL